MCERFALLRKFDEIAAWYDARPFGGVEWQENYNISPKQLIPVLVEEPDGRELRLMQWGLIPFWAKADKIGASMINARADSLQEKPGFRDSFKDKRCIIPASGFYAWQKLIRSKEPWYFTPKDDLFSFAGLWSRWISPDSIEVESCAIVITNANELVKPVSDSMPVVLERDHWSAWIAKATKPNKLLEMLTPLPAKQMTATRVSTYVNTAKNAGPKCIAALNTP